MAEQDVPIRNASVFFKGKRVAWMQSAKYTLQSNDTQEQTDGGTYFTDGRTTGKLTCNQLIPVRGTGLSMVEDALAHKTVDLQIGLIEGKVHNTKGRNASIDIDTDVANGKLTGAFEFMVNKPKIA